jgi:diadenylate cyclase
MDDQVRAVLAAVAPGTPLRDGLERIVRGRTGALVIMGFDDTVDAMCTGGFQLDVDFSATRLRELAKMDGAIVIDREAASDSGVGRIVRAAVHLVPDPHVETVESGTRHRTAERVAKQSGHPVISVSQSMSLIALYVGERRRVLEGSTEILTRANQALATLERYSHRLQEVTSALAGLEIEDLASVRDVATVMQRAEMVRRISAEVEEYLVELGTDGRLLSLQLDELISGLGAERRAVVRDYVGTLGSCEESEEALFRLTELTPGQLVDLTQVAGALGFTETSDPLDVSVSPRGYRMLHRVPRLSEALTERIVQHFGSLQKMLAAGVDDFSAVEGIGPVRARAIREGLSRLAETSILERYV